MSVSAAAQAFSAHAFQYTALRRRLVPDLDTFYGLAVATLSSGARKSVDRVLDLGAGTGLLALAVAEAYPEARFELLDGSAAMLSEAEQTLQDKIDAVHVQDMAESLPGGPFDAVISALAIHHLEDPDKRDLYARVFEVLEPGGVFVNAEQVAGPTRELTRRYVDLWIAECREAGATQADIDGALERRKHDRCTDVATQTGWLLEAGFEAADCIYRRGERAVIFAVKRAAGSAA